jgi:hypothetical protein
MTLSIIMPGEAQATTIPVVIPVHGQLALPSGYTLYKIDTYTGNMQVLLDRSTETQEPKLPYWDSQGERLVVDLAGPHSTILNVTDGTTQIVDIFPGYTFDHTFWPAGWSNDGTNILYKSFLINSFESVTTTFHLMNVSTTSLTQIGEVFERGQSLPAGFPLPSGIDQALLISFSYVIRNPRYDQWVLLQLEAVNADLATDIAHAPPEAHLRINVLWNYVTGQMLSLDGLFPATMFSEADWSQDGERLLVPLRGIVLGTIRFENPAGAASVSAIDSAPTERVVEYWLDAGDFLIASQGDEASGDRIYYIAEIINGTWHETEFFRLPQGNSIPLKRGDWYLSASEAEKQALSCLFDQALPTQLAIGARARVNFTDGTPLRLRAEPSLDAAEIMRMPEGTEFTIIAGPACENAARYYRFWQVQLDDGIVGWAAEADNSDYFIEPVSAE